MKNKIAFYGACLTLIVGSLVAANGVPTPALDEDTTAVLVAVGGALAAGLRWWVEDRKGEPPA